MTAQASPLAGRIVNEGLIHRPEAARLTRSERCALDYAKAISELTRQ